MSRNLRGTSISCLAMLAFFGGSGTAWAQDQEPAQSGDSAVSVEDIVVTAQRREQSLQEVPIAVSALSSTMLEVRGITDSGSLATSIPGVQIPRVYSSALPFIRGIGSLNSATGDESANAIYIDGVYRPSQPGGLFSFNAVERVEVLKGPQGTLFGRNALGGVISVITKNPTQDYSFDGQVGYGNYETFEASGYLNGGITKNVSAALALYYQNQNEGWGKNLVNNRDIYKGKEFSARLKVRWESPDGDTDATLSADYNNFYANTGFAFTAYKDAVLLDGSRADGFYNVRTNVDRPKAQTEQYGADLTVNHDFGGVRLTSITSYREVIPDLVNDQEGTALSIVNINQYNPSKTFSQELQLQSGKGSSVSWVAGLYYFDTQQTNEPLRLTGSAFPLPFLEIRDKITNTSYAAFGQATVPLGERTNVTAGLRYTRDERGAVGATYTAPGIFPGDIVPNTVADQKANFGKLTYKLVLDHHWTDDVMTYASFSRGYKSGLFNGVAPTDPVTRPSTLDAFEIGAKTEFFDNRIRLNVAAFYYDYQDIQLTILAVGRNRLLNAAKGKVKGFDAELEAAITENFRLQASMTYLHARFGDFPGATSNIPNVDINGNPTGGNRPVPILDEDGNNNGRGLTMPYAPALTANLGAQYTIPSSIGDFRIAANAAYNSGAYRDPDNRLKDPKYTLVNASLGWTSSNEQFDVKIWGRNLLDEKYYTYLTASGVGDIASPASPATYGITIGFHY